MLLGTSQHDQQHTSHLHTFAVINKPLSLSKPTNNSNTVIMQLRSGNDYPACEVPSASAAVRNSKQRKSKPESGISSKMHPGCQWLLDSTYHWIRDLLYHLMLFTLLSTVLIVIASPFIGNNDPPCANPYEILGVTPLAARTDIKEAYKKLSLEHHPDKTASNKSEEVAYFRIREAYETLNVEDHVRCMYDLTHDIKGRWSVEECITARKDYVIREDLRRAEELEKTRQKIETEKKERQRRREERWGQQEKMEGAKFTSRSKAAIKSWFASVHAPW